MPRYLNMGVDLMAFATNTKRYLESSGYKVSKMIPGRAGFYMELKKGFFGKKLVVRVAGHPNDVRVEVSGPDWHEVMDLVEQALVDSSSNPSALVSWRQQAREEAVRTISSLGAIFGVPQPAPQPTPQAAPQPAPQPKRPKLEACLKCGAPLRYDPEEILVVCEYCGFINNVTGEPPPKMGMLPILVSGADALRIAKDYASKSIFVTRRMAEEAQWGEIALRYIPVWSVAVQLEGEVIGKKALIKTKDFKKQVAQELGMQALGAALGGILGGGLGGRLGRTVAGRTERIWVSETVDVPVVARRAPEYQPDPGKYVIPLERKEPYRKTGEEMLGAEVGAQEAMERAKSIALQDLRARFTVVSKFSVTAIPVGEPELIYAPWWFIRYVMGGKEYSVIVDACSGAVIAGKRPWIPKGVIRRGGGVVA